MIGSQHEGGLLAGPRFGADSSPQGLCGDLAEKEQDRENRLENVPDLPATSYRPECQFRRVPECQDPQGRRNPDPTPRDEEGSPKKLEAPQEEHRKGCLRVERGRHVCRKSKCTAPGWAWCAQFLRMADPQHRGICNGLVALGEA